jgi:hypothetical protein
VEVLIDLGRPGGHLCVLVVLFLFGAGRLVEVLDLARTPLPGKHIVEEAGEGEEQVVWWWLSEERRRVRSSACGGDRSERRETTGLDAKCEGDGGPYCKVRPTWNNGTWAQLFFSNPNAANQTRRQPKMRMEWYSKEILLHSHFIYVPIN